MWLGVQHCAHTVASLPMATKLLRTTLEPLGPALWAFEIGQLGIVAIKLLIRAQKMELEKVGNV